MTISAEFFHSRLSSCIVCTEQCSRGNTEWLCPLRKRSNMSSKFLQNACSKVRFILLALNPKSLQPDKIYGVLL